MLIRTQDKKGIVDSIKIFINRELGGKTRLIYERYAGKMLLSDNNTVVGTYQGDEAVISEIDEMMRFFTNNPTGIYEMR